MRRLAPLLALPVVPTGCAAPFAGPTPDSGQGESSDAGDTRTTDEPRSGTGHSTGTASSVTPRPDPESRVTDFVSLDVSGDTVTVVNAKTADGLHSLYRGAR